MTLGTVRLEDLTAMALLLMIIAGAAGFPLIAMVGVVISVLLLMATMDHLLPTFVEDQTPIFAMAAIDLEVALLLLTFVAGHHPFTADPAALPRFAMDPVALPSEVAAAMDAVDATGRTKALPEFLFWYEMWHLP